MLGEDVQDQGGAVQDAHFIPEDLLQLTQVARAELFIEEDDFRQRLLRQHAHFLHFARTDIGLGVGMLEALVRLTHHIQPGGICQERQLIQRILDGKQRFLPFDLDADKEGSFARSYCRFRLFFCH